MFGQQQHCENVIKVPGDLPHHQLGPAAQAVAGPLLVQPRVVAPHPGSGPDQALLLPVHRVPGGHPGKQEMTPTKRFARVSHCVTDWTAGCADLLDGAEGLDGAADDAHAEVLLLGGAAGAGAGAAGPGLGLHQALGLGHRHHQVPPLHCTPTTFTFHCKEFLKSIYSLYVRRTNTIMQKNSSKEYFMILSFLKSSNGKLKFRQ